jgi:hypothetical protein
MRRSGFLVLLATVGFSVEALQTVFRPSPTVSRVGPLRDSKEEEIAKLEEQLRRLREENKAEQPAYGVAEDEKKFDDVPLDMFMTEQWKVQEAESARSGGGFSGVLYAVAAVLALALFSQVPIGQEDLSKYSVGNSPAAEQIDLGDLNRARRSGDL